MRGGAPGGGRGPAGGGTPAALGETPRFPRRAALRAAAAAAGGAALAGCRWGPPPPPPVRLRVGAEPLPQAALATVFDVAYPDTRLVFGGTTPPSAVGLRDTDLGPGVLGGLLPLRGFLEVAGFSPVDVDPATWAAFGAQGVQRGVPLARSRLAVLYDAALLASARVARPRPDWTLGDFLGMCARLAAARPGSPVLARLEAAVAQGLWTTLVAGYGGRLVDSDGRFAPRAGTAGIQAMRAFARVLSFASASAWGEAAVPSAGRPALALRHFVLQQEIDDWLNARIDVGLARFPALPAATLVPAAAWAHGIPRGAPERGAALRFLVWTAGFDGQRFVRGLGLIPVLLSMEAQPPLLVAPGGFDSSALAPSEREDLYAPAALRRVPGAAAAFAATVGRLRGTGVAAEEAAAAYAAGAAAANRALDAAGYRGEGAWPPARGG